MLRSSRPRAACAHVLGRVSRSLGRGTWHGGAWAEEHLLRGDASSSSFHSSARTDKARHPSSSCCDWQIDGWDKPSTDPAAGRACTSALQQRVHLECRPRNFPPSFQSTWAHPRPWASKSPLPLQCTHPLNPGLQGLSNSPIVPAHSLPARHLSSEPLSSGDSPASAETGSGQGDSGEAGPSSGDPDPVPLPEAEVAAAETDVAAADADVVAAEADVVAAEADVVAAEADVVAAEAVGEGTVQAQAASLEGISTRDELHSEMQRLQNQLKFSQANSLFFAWMQTRAAAQADGLPELKTWNLVLKGMVREQGPVGPTHSLGALEDLVRVMQRKGVEPDAETFHLIIYTALRRKVAALAVEFMAEMQEKGMVPDVACFNQLVSLSSANRRMGQALKQMQSMLRLGLQPTPMAAVDLILGCARSRRIRDAVAALKDAEGRGLRVMPYVMGEVLTCAAEGDDPDCALAVLQMLQRDRRGRPTVLDLGTGLLVLGAAARTGHPQLAEKVWSILVTSYGSTPPIPALHLARLQAYSTVRDFRAVAQALVEFEGALSSGAVESFSLSPGTAEEQASRHLSLLCPFTSLGSVTHALSDSVNTLDNVYFLLEHQLSLGQVLPRSLVNCIIAGCATIRDVHRAELTFQEMQSTLKLTPDANTYTALIAAYGRSKQGALAEAQFQACIKAGVKPTYQGHLARFWAHILGFNAPEALKAVNYLVESGNIPSRDVLVQLLRRSERSGYVEGVERAQELLAAYSYRNPLTADLPRRKQIFDVARKCLRDQSI